MALHNLSRRDLAEKIGISLPTLISRLENGNWKYYELMLLIDLFKIDNPQEIFFQGAVA